MPDRDYYEILGVAKDATPEQIKKAYRSLARQHHPDVNPGDKKAEAKFKEAQGAYDVLSEPEKRALYDRYGRAAFESMGAAGPNARAPGGSARHAGPGGQVFDFSEFFGPGFQHEGGTVGEGGETEGGFLDDLLGQFRGTRGGRRSRPRRRGRSIEAYLSIPFETAVKGGETTIEIQRSDGSHERLAVKIPPGTEPGARLRLRGQGEKNESDQEPGDLMITVVVDPHPFFTREGRDLFVEVPVTVAEAILGAKVDVPTLNGLKTLTIPPGTSSGQKLRLRGQGVPAVRDKPAGDLFVVIKIIVPKSVDDRSKALIKEFAERNPYNPREELW
jgi:curved DNA-binding protein